MSVIRCNEIWFNRRADETDTNTEYERVFRLFTNNTNDGPRTILDFSGVPQLFDFYMDANGNVDNDAFCNHREPMQDQDDPNTWMLRCYYTRDITASPWLDPPEVEWGSEKIQEVVFQEAEALTDSNGQYILDSEGEYTYKAILTSAGEMFDPPVTVNETVLTLTVTMNQLSFDRDLISGYQDAINSDVWQGFAVRKVKVDSISASKVKTPNFDYWKVKYVFHIRDRGWRKKIYDMGYKELVPVPLTNAGQQRMILDPTGHPVSSPWPLDGNGHAITLNTSLSIQNQLHLLEFRIYPEIPFADLNIPLV